jgi:hypothetical protein
MMGQFMLLNAALIIVALLLMVLAIWGWARATDRPANPRERDFPGAKKLSVAG